jgi:class 3 adenylate cyclase/tetratricopeptide (TPR) repeat protein
MAACGSCGAGNPDGYRFCGQCGSSLAVSICGSCGRQNPAGQAFCGECGIPLDTPLKGTGLESQRTSGDPGKVPESELEERKLATVLFADVVGFTSLADKTDHEVVARMVDAAFRRLSEVVAEHGGIVDKYMGDSVMAVFGVPVAHDDDAERAVAAGLAMRELGGDLAFSIGINSGEVMAAYVGRAGDFTVIGDTVNVAARLEKIASAGEVLCGRLTVELAGRGAVFRERRPVLLKGKREPVHVWEAVDIRQMDGLRAETDPRTGGPPLIGRSDELAFLESQWRRVCRDRRAQVVVICGDAGYGKTRLLGELARCAERDGTVVRAAYPAYGAMGGPRVAAEIVRQLGPLEDPEVNARLRSASGEIDPSLQSVDPAGIRQEQLWAFRRLLHEKSLDRPLLVVIDDMHRSGDQTLSLLSELSGRVDDVPLLTVLAGRTEPGDWLSRFPTATRVPLGPLSRDDSAVLAGAFVGEKPITSEATNFLVDRANGNPLYMRELVVMARERGLLVDDGEVYRLREADLSSDESGDDVADGPDDEDTDASGNPLAASPAPVRALNRSVLPATVPATLQALLAARLDALEPARKLVVQHVAVMGEAATAEQISMLGSPEAASALRALADAGLLRQSPDGHFDTVDPLLREVAYETLPRNVRGELHRRAARSTSGAEERARHLDRAANYLADDEIVAKEAADALADAGEALIDASRHLDAVRLLERAVARGCTRNSALLGLARAQALCGRTEDALETLSLIEDDPADPSVAVERDHTKAGARMFSKPDEALPSLKEAAERWSALGNTGKEAWALANAGVAAFYMSRMEEAASLLERGLELFEQVDDKSGAVATASFLCLVKPADRRVPGWLAGALEFAEEVGDRSRELTVLTTLAWHLFFRSFCGNPDQVAEASNSARRMAELAEELGANDMAIHGWSLLAIMQRMSGRIELASVSVAALERVMRGPKPNDRWLAWAATFSVTVARGEWGVSPPFPPESSPDPVSAMAALIVEAELTMAGRVPEALSRFENFVRPDLGPIGDLGGVFHAIALVAAGRGQEALGWVQRSAGAARALDAAPTSAVAAALLAEITGDNADLPEAPAEAQSVSDVLVLRAHAASGDPDAVAALHAAVACLAMPGLAAGI